jgi:hypothetical protein
VTRPIGNRKAEKFSAVEGLSLSQKSRQTLRECEARGLQGQALRDAIADTFKKN